MPYLDAEQVVFHPFVDHPPYTGLKEVLPGVGQELVRSFMEPKYGVPMERQQGRKGGKNKLKYRSKFAYMGIK